MVEIHVGGADLLGDPGHDGATQRDEPGGAAPATSTPGDGQAGRRSGVGAAKGAALLAAGLLVGALVVTVGDPGRADPGASNAAVVADAGTTGTAPAPGAARLRRGAGRGPEGALRLVGTVSAVAPGTVTVRGVDGSDWRVAVTQATEVVQDGDQVPVGALAVGAPVVLSVRPDGTAELIVAGQLGGDVPGRQPGEPSAQGGTATGLAT